MSTTDKIEGALGALADTYRLRVERLSGRCESPIEKLLFLAMLRARKPGMIARPCSVPPELCGDDQISDHGEPIAESGGAYVPGSYSFDADWRRRGEAAGLDGSLLSEPAAWARIGGPFERWIFIQAPLQLGDRNIRLDLAIVGNGWKIALECDGHEYHERTKEQAARDRSRDRALQLKGWVVLRFTGSEINRSSARCVRQIWETVLCEDIRSARTRKVS